ncbi:MAG: type II secretion system F family protein [Planctomycetota bacterium]|jgi:tight adherence protein C
MIIAQMEILIPLLAFMSIILIGSSFIISQTEKKRVIEERLRDKAAIGLQKVETRKKTGFIPFIEKLGNLASHGNPSTTLWEQLTRAGYYHSTATAIYTGIKLFLFISGLVLCTILVMPLESSVSSKITIASLGGVALFFIPNIVVLVKLRKRHNEIKQHLPVMIDLLEICVSSGIALDMAWNIVCDEIRHVSSVLANSMSLASFEMHLGSSRIEAMRNMSRRTGVDELSSLAAILIQTDRFGTSIADTLKIFAESMRQERSFSAQEAAEKMAVKLLIPMILFFFPAVLIVAVGPAIINITRTLGSVR